MANVLDCDIVVSEFELQSRYYLHFETNTTGKRHELPYPPTINLLNSITTNALGLKLPMKVDITLSKVTKPHFKSTIQRK